MRGNTQITEAMKLALAQASKFRGATSPNPPVGAAALDSEGQIMGVVAHERAGEPHAEALLLAKLKSDGLLEKTETLVVTLEPCNHHGRTPPCVEAILNAGGIRQVVIGALDPNPKVPGGGADALRQAGIQVETGILKAECEALIAPFHKWSKTGIPWISLKIALNEVGSMIPEAGQKTFTSEDSLRFAHGLRKRADAILTGSGTILADQPKFTVRLVPDHPGKKRTLAILDRRSRVPAETLARFEAEGFHVFRGESLPNVLEHLGKIGVLEVLVEAGPSVTSAILDAEAWDEKIVIQKRGPGLEDRISVEFRSTCSQGL